MSPKVYVILGILLIMVAGIFLYRAQGPQVGELIETPLVAPIEVVDAVPEPEAPTPETVEPAPAVEFTQAGNAMLEGRILNPGGRPIEGAEVFLHEWLPPESSSLLDIFVATAPRPGVKLTGVITAEDGVYRFSNLDGGNYILSALSASYAQNGLEVLQLSEQETRSELNLTLYPSGRIFGTVLDESQRPIAGAKVKAIRVEQRIALGSPVWSKFDLRETDAAGRFNLEHLLPGTYTLQVTAAGFAPGEQGNVPTGGEEVQLMLNRGLIIRGRVLNERNQPILGADIQVLRSSQDGFAALQSPQTFYDRRILTGRDGSFVLEGLPMPEHNRPMVVLAVARGYQTVSWTVDPNLPDLQEVTLILPGGARIEGLVQGYNGRPLSGVMLDVLRVRTEDGAVLGATRRPWMMFYSTRGGRFEVYGIPAGHADLRFTAKGYAAHEIRDVSTSSPPLNVILEAGGAILGRVLQAGDSSVGASGVRVNAWHISEAAPQLQPLTVWTDSAGEFSLEGLTAGRYEVWASLSGLPGPDKTTLELKPGQVITGLEFRLRSQQSIHGRVLSFADRLPVSGAEIVAIGERGRRTVSSDAGGFFFFDGLIPGVWKLGARAEGFVYLPPGSMPGLTVELAEGQTLQDVPMLLSKGALLIGQVLDTAGEPVSGALVFTTTPDPSQTQALAPDEHPLPAANTRTDSEGRFTLNRVVVGRDFVLVADHPSYAPLRSGVLQLSEGERRDLGTLRLELRGWLMGQLKNTSGQPVEGKVEVEGRAQETEADGVFRLERLPSGNRILRITAKGYKPRELPVIIEPDLAGTPLEVILEPL